MADKLDPVRRKAHFDKIRAETAERHKDIAKHADSDGNVTVRVTYKGIDKISKGEGPNVFFEQDDEFTCDIAKADILQERSYIEVKRKQAKASKAD